MDRIVPPDETSLRYPGWRVVIVCFVARCFSGGLGFYGPAVYLAFAMLVGFSSAIVQLTYALGPALLGPSPSTGEGQT